MTDERATTTRRCIASAAQLLIPIPIPIRGTHASSLYSNNTSGQKSPLCTNNPRVREQLCHHHVILGVLSILFHLISFPIQLPFLQTLTTSVTMIAVMVLLEGKALVEVFKRGMGGGEGWRGLDTSCAEEGRQ